MLLFVLATVGCVLGVLLAFGVALLWFACWACAVRRPPVPVACGIVFVSWFALTVAEAGLKAVAEQVYAVLGYPSWEVWLACLFVGLPLDLGIASVLHAAMMRERLGKAVEVWFVQRLVLLSVALAAAGVAAVYILARG